MHDDLRTVESRTMGALAGTAAKRRGPPRGNSDIEHIFCGQFGLALIATATYVCDCGQSLD
eukprot:7627473-Pyramimonas_sp.AAC.1